MDYDLFFEKISIPMTKQPNLLLLLFFCGLVSCTNSKTKHWSIPLYSTNGSLEIELPIFFDTLKKSVNVSDCGDCGKFHTILTDKNFIKNIEDTTGFIIPWLCDSLLKIVFYIEEKLHPFPSTKIDEKSVEDYLNNTLPKIESLYSNVRIFKKSVKNGMSIIYYETYDENGLLKSKVIKCISSLNNQPIYIEFIQNYNFKNDLSERIWNSIQNMRLIENK